MEAQVAAECPYSSLDVLSNEFNDHFDEVTAELLERCPVVSTPAGWLTRTLQ